MAAEVPQTMPTWNERIEKAAQTFAEWYVLPLEIRLDKAIKAAGFRDVILENERLRGELNRSRSYRESQEGLPEGTLPRV